MKPYLLPVLLITGCLLTGCQTIAPKTPEAVLADKTSQLVIQHKLPSLSITLFNEKAILQQSAKGVRKYGSPEEVTLQDVHHLGSITKSMTATLIATYVESHKLSFQSKLKELLPDTEMREEYQNITIDQLLSHRSGIVDDLEPQPGWWDASIPLATRKADFIKDLLQTPLKHAPGTAFEYSNPGYALLAAILEKVGKKPFETLIETQLFNPLHMKGCSMGYTWDVSSVSQPWPHVLQAGVPVPVPPVYPTQENNLVVAGNTEVIDGADNVRCPMSDLVLYGQAHMNGENGKNGFLKASTFQELHKDHYGDQYGYGWVVNKTDSGELVLGHDGSNTLNYASLILIPAFELGTVGVSNIGGDEAQKAIYAGMTQAFQLGPSGHQQLKPAEVQQGFRQRGSGLH
ncbi:serine hydrolase domain-containing protein [Deinococcus roseus]|uniref:Beta-lactamase-related domain-containing protein n=1 Tax=Deinococcus roseus TaxID=392414 RepID=A0ABQ2CU37_9DEIO|nr:serine hydrolase domain-containing protein [Deinococcus roseus]GGJ19644.1 hypothetical protein GCM10008938_02180 [Deinococcus roseus]